MFDNNPNSTSLQSSFDDTEEWRDVPGYEGLYTVSSKGQVRNSFDRILKPYIGNKYLRIRLCKNGKIWNASVHIIVALAFIGSRPSLDHQVDHRNRQKLDNRVTNLQYLLRSINQGKDSSYPGEKSPNSKLSDCQRCKIKHLWASGRYKTKTELAKSLNIERRLVNSIIVGSRGANVDCSKFAETDC